MLKKSIVGLQQKRIDEMKEIERELLDVPIGQRKNEPMGAVVPEATSLEAMSPLHSINKLRKQQQEQI